MFPDLVIVTELVDLGLGHERAKRASGNLVLCTRGGARRRVFVVKSRSVDKSGAVISTESCLFRLLLKDSLVR